MQRSKSLMFTKGDLIHIPQSVILYGVEPTASIYINKKPSLAIFIDYADDGMAQVILNGKSWLVKNREIYLNRGAE